MRQQAEPESDAFEHARAGKPDEHGEVPNLQWYVVLVANVGILDPKLDGGNFRFSFDPPNPEIQPYFDRQVPPHLCATELFQRRDWHEQA